MKKNFLALLIALVTVAVASDWKDAETPAAETTPAPPISSLTPEKDSQWASVGYLQRGQVLIAQSPPAPTVLYKQPSSNLLTDAVQVTGDRTLKLSSPCYLQVALEGDHRWTRFGSLQAKVDGNRIRLLIPVERFTGDHIRNYMPSYFRSEAVKLEGLKGSYHIYLGDTLVGEVEFP